MFDKDRTPVAQDIDAFCAKCKLQRAHVVMAHVGGLVEKIQCKICHSTHKYRSEARKAASSGRIRSRLKIDDKTKPLKSYTELVEQFRENPSHPYKMSDKYNANDIILHPKYEKGVVVKVYGNKMDVMFPRGVCTLVCNRL